MKISDLAQFNLPDAPGVYFFQKGKEILYIGRATSLKDRVRSYFSNDLIETRGRRIVDMVVQADNLEFRETMNVLEAIFLEASLIKEHLPKYNVNDKDNKSFFWVVLTDEDFPAVRTVRGRELALHEQGVKKLPFSVKRAYGPFESGGVIREALRLVRRIFPYRDEKCIPLGEKSAAKPCFNRQIGLCPGPCVGAITGEEYAKTVRRLVLFLGGKVGELKKTLTKEMKDAVESEQFERAESLKRILYALDHISDVSLLKATSARPIDSAGGVLNAQVISRIEAYDIAHTGGSAARGVMTVLKDGEPIKSNYRVFKLNNTKPGDDIGGLKEILSRRLTHEEWSLPDLVVVDGGLPAKHAAEIELKRVGLISIPVIAVTKDERHRPRAFQGDKGIIARLEKEIVLVNAEAHRFSLNRHRKTRGKIA